MLTIKGIAVNITGSLVGRITSGKSLFLSDGDIMLIEQYPSLKFGGSGFILRDDIPQKKTRRPTLYLGPADFSSLKNNDIVKIESDGSLHVLWVESSPDNVIYTTDSCNSACIMCPQIPVGEPYSYYEQNHRMLNLVKDSYNLCNIGITGGEPTLFKEEIVNLLSHCFQKFPTIPVAMLTNGKNFDDFDFAKECALSNANMTYCIPLYASYSEKHDYIVGMPGSFERTLNGIYNLVRLKQRIEIRVVLLKQNYEDLPLLMDYIYQNLPFVSHIALMGMEITGMAQNNLSDVWIDPTAYENELKLAALKLRRYNLLFSIYNIPRCLLSRELWGYDKDSISAWKKVYLEKCDGCIEKKLCCGVFATSSKQSDFISPFLE